VDTVQPHKATSRTYVRAKKLSLQEENAEASSILGDAQMVMIVSGLTIMKR
jgi:hypothetical protein